MKISKRVREEAAMICQLAASNEWLPFSASLSQFSWDDDATTLAERACRWSRTYQFGIIEPWCESECLLRTGWSPP